MRKYHLQLKATIFVLSFLLFILTSLSSAESSKTITLKDGSVIKGSVIQLSDGVYTLNTDNLGKVNVPESDIVSITTSSETAASPEETSSPSNPNQQFKDQAQQFQNNLMSDPQIIAEMQNIMQDPEIRGVLSDPAFMNTILSYDPNKIQQNEKTQQLLTNPKFKALMEKIQAKLPQSK